MARGLAVSPGGAGITPVNVGDAIPNRMLGSSGFGSSPKSRPLTNTKDFASSFDSTRSKSYAGLGDAPQNAELEAEKTLSSL